MTDYVCFLVARPPKSGIEKTLIFYYIIVSKRTKERF